MTKDGWKWVDENGEALSRNGIDTGGSWCLDKDNGSWPYADRENCLNLDREGYGTPLFYGLPCNATSQYVLCNLSAKTNTRLPFAGTIEANTDKNIQTQEQDLSKNVTLSEFDHFHVCFIIVRSAHCGFSYVFTFQVSSIKLRTWQREYVN